MTKEDKILFEQFFYAKCSANIKGKNSYLDIVLNCLLNSKEFNDSPLKISDISLDSIPLSLSVYIKKGLINFSLMYYVTDGINTENRTMYGDIVINEGEFFIVADIDRYGEISGVKHSVLIESFEPDYEKNNYSRHSFYSMIDFNSTEKIRFDEFDKVDEFKSYALKMIKSR